MHKIMALDIGTKRIGIALSDYLHVLANGHSYISRIPENEAVEKIKKIAKENNVKDIVIGVPYNMDGSQGSQADDCITFSKNFEEYNIIKEDERLTSDAAEENLRNKKIDFRKDKGLVDIESACIILEQYLSKIN
ncbi:Holliday junction resolvase RuvX [bacterium]|nr:Holliday junction resolvase RuvX [bacterium]